MFMYRKFPLPPQIVISILNWKSTRLEIDTHSATGLPYFVSVEQNLRQIIFVVFWSPRAYKTKPNLVFWNVAPVATPFPLLSFIDCHTFLGFCGLVELGV